MQFLLQDVQIAYILHMIRSEDTVQSQLYKRRMLKDLSTAIIGSTQRYEGLQQSRPFGHNILSYA